MAERTGKKVKAFDRSSPYGMCAVQEVRDNGNLGPPMLFPITHREDFKVLWWLRNEADFGPSHEVLLGYQPAGTLSSMRPKLHVKVYGAGWVNDYLAARTTEGGRRTARIIEHHTKYRPLFDHPPGPFD